MRTWQDTRWHFSNVDLVQILVVLGAVLLAIWVAIQVFAG
jgi:hypothetical protein